MFNKHKFPLILSSLVTLLPIPVQLLLGRDWGVAMGIPLILFATFWIGVWFTLKDNQGKNQSIKGLRVVLWTIPALSIFTATVDYALTTGMELNVQRIFCLFFGILFLVIGNYLPKVRQNYTYGIKIGWVYSSEENWNATHRFGGKVWFFCGPVILLGAFLPGELGFYCMTVAIAVAVIAPTAYSYLFYRKQKKAGVALKPMPVLPGKSAKTSLLFLAALVLFVACVLFTGDLEYVFGETSFTVEASYFDDLTVSYADIKDVKYLDHNMEGYRIWGFGSLRLLMGTFEHEDIQYTRYTYYDPDSAVGVMLADRIIVLSGKNPEESQALYQTLLEKTGIQ